MERNRYVSFAQELTDILGLASSPVAISFLSEEPKGIPPYGGVQSPPTADGRTGTVSAGCVFWIKGTERTFATYASDHGNCSVGSVTHGLLDLSEAATRADVAALCESKWVSPSDFGSIATVKTRPAAIVYGPLAECTFDPTVVLLRLSAKQVMVLRDACPDVRFEGKPQCHIIAIAKEEEQISVSVGCMLSRVRTGMSNTEMTCAIPFNALGHTIEKLKSAWEADTRVARYASEDGQRFA